MNTILVFFKNLTIQFIAAVVGVLPAAFRQGSIRRSDDQLQRRSAVYCQLPGGYYKYKRSTLWRRTV